MTEMRHVDHTHPRTGGPFGFRLEPYARVVADGGEEEEGEDDEETMADVAHAAGETEGQRRSFERGTEGRVQHE